MKKQVNVDILLATFNGERFIHELIDSLLNQTYCFWTLLIHDDGSDDATISIVKDYSGRFPDRIMLKEDGIKFGSACRNFNHLMSYSKSEYIMFCDQDDVWLPNKIEVSLVQLHELSEKNPGVPVMVFSDLIVVDEYLNTICPSLRIFQNITGKHMTFASELNDNVAYGCGVALNRQALVMLTPLPEKAIIHDWWIFLNVLIYGRFRYIAQPLVKYRQHAKNGVGAKTYDFLPLLKRYLSAPFFTNKRLIDLRNRMFRQLEAFLGHIDKTKADTASIALLEKYLQLEDRWFQRKLFQIKNGLLTGNFEKKLGKFLFY